jgi:hypothetical protein
MRMYLVKKCNNVAVCRVWRYGRSPMVLKSAGTRRFARNNFKRSVILSDRWVLLGKASVTAMRFWKSGFKFASRRNKTGKVFGILSQLEKLNKSNDVHARNKTFLSST